MTDTSTGTRKNTARFLRGAFVEAPANEQNGAFKPIYFQFNPETVERTKTGTWTSAQSQRQKADDAATNKTFQDFRNKKVKAGYVPAPEKINLTLRLDSREKSYRSKPLTQDTSAGILPELSALESLMKKVSIESTAGGSKKSATLVRTKQIPMVLFLWGGSRVLPVTIMSMTITEQVFDPLLNPIRAEVKVSLQVLEEEDAKLNALAIESFTFTEKEKERMKNNFFTNQQNANEGMTVPGGYPKKLKVAQGIKK